MNLKTLATAHRFFKGMRLALALCAALVLAALFGMWIKPSAQPLVGFKCIHEGQVSYCTSKESSLFHTIPVSTELQFGKVIALQAEHIGDIIADLVLKAKVPIVALVQDKEQEEYVVLIDQAGELSVSSVNSLLKDTSAVLDGKLKVQTASQEEAVYFKMWPIVSKP